MALLKRTNQAQEFTHVTQEMYKKNLELNERNKTLALLRKIDEVVLASASDSKKVAQQIADTIVADTDFKIASIFLKDDKAFNHFATNKYEATNLEQAVVKLLTEEVAPGHRISEVIKTGQVGTASLHDLLQDHLQHDEAEQIGKLMEIGTLFICPLVVRGQLMGVMIIGSPQTPDQLTEYKHNLIARLAGVVAIALDSSLLYKELQLANKHLQELDKAKDEFISMASHQLRTPLTTIKGYLSMLEEGDAGKINFNQKAFIENASSGTTRMAKMIGELLNVSRMSTGKFKIEPKPVDLGQVVQEEVDQLMIHADARDLKLIYKKPAKPVDCSIDEDKTRQVIMNFIDNAIYYTKKGSITVSVEDKPNTVVFRVVDTGIGVPKVVRDKLFTKFYRADNAKIARPDGTGLGLFLAKRVIQDQGGKIIFESEEAKGSTFGFELPKSVKPGEN